MSDFDSDCSDSSFTDEEAQLEDLRKLKAVLEHDPFQIDITTYRTASICTANDEYAKVQTALLYNKMTEEKFIQLEKVLVGRLRECRKRLSDIHQASLNQKTEKCQQIFRYVFCGKPYFRDKDNFPAPDNNDTITMERSGMYDYSNVACLAGWTVKDKQDFLTQILKYSRKIKKEQIESKLNCLIRHIKKEDSKSLQQEIITLKKQIGSINKATLDKALVLSLDQEYDWEAIANALNYRHTPEEYQALWKLFLHPTINKKTWEKSEHAKLRDIATANKLQDWDKIASELNTGRTGYQCFVYYRTNMGTNTTGQKWSKEEEEYLRRLIDYYREDNYIPWGKVATSMENRNKIQIYNKYARLMELRKGRFLPEEDAVLLTGVGKYGTNFKIIAKYVPGRSASQLRVRYNVLNSATRTSVVWKFEEDKKLIQLMANQDSSQYINYANLTSHFPNKDRNQLRARYVTLLKWMKKHPNRDISRAPRRGARRLIHGKREGDMNLAIEKLSKRMRCEIETKKSKKITKDSPEDVIEHGIIAALITESAKEEDMEELIPDNELSDKDMQLPLNGAINETNLRKLLILLKAKLNKQTFEISLYATKYPKLKQVEAESFSVRVKSYSRKAATNVITVGGQIHPPDIWGNNKLTTSEYVLPPNYSTITGCRRLMSFASNKTPQSNRATGLNQYTHRNILIKEHVDIFMERFNTLFLWPILLSNEPPKEENRCHPIKMHIEKNVRRREHLRLPAGLSIIIPNKVTKIVQENIDLPSRTKVAISVKPKIGNDDFMYIEDNSSDEDNSEYDDDNSR